MAVLALILSACGMRTTEQGATGALQGTNAQSGGNLPDISGDETAVDGLVGTDAGGTEAEAGSSPGAGPSNAGVSAGSGVGTRAATGAASAKAAPATGTRAQSGSSPAAVQSPSKTQAAAPGQPSPAPGQPAPGGSSGGGGGKAELPGSINSPGPDSQGITDDKIRIGVVAPISGAAGFLGQSAVDGITAFANMINEQGGVNGRMYQLVIADSQFDQAVEATVTKRLVEKANVFALMSVVGDSSAAYVTSVGIPNVTLGVMPPAYSSKYPTTFPLTMQIVDFVAGMAHQLKNVLKIPIKSTAILYGNQNFAWAKWAKYAKLAWESLGVEVKSMDQFDISDGDCTSIVLKMKSLNIDFWQVAQSVGWPLCQQAMARQNYTPPLGRGGPFTATYNYVSQAGLAMHEVYGMNYGIQIGKNTCEPYTYEPGISKAPQCENYINSMKKYATDASVESLEDVWAQLFWTGGKLIDDALRHQTGALTWDGMIKWIGGQKHWLSGLAPPIDFTPTCKKGSSWWIFQWLSDGEKLVQSDWQPFGGSIQVPTDMKNKIFPGAGDCFVTALTDAEIN